MLQEREAGKMATEEVMAIERHVKDCARRHGTRMRFLRSGPNAYRHRPAIYVEGFASPSSTHRVLHMDHLPGPDGYRVDGLHARQSHVNDAVAGGMPTQAMLDEIDRMVAWRAFEERRVRLLGGMGFTRDDAPDWSRTAHVIMLAAHGVDGVEKRITLDANTPDKLKQLEETSGYIHGRTEIGVSFNQVLDHRNQLFVPGALPDTVGGQMVGRSLQDLVAFHGADACPPVAIVSMGGYGGPDGPAPMMIVGIEDVRATLAPPPAGVDPALLLPPGARFWNMEAPAWIRS
jgi:hypothetical protein